jgi:hypothetical protein
MRKSKKFFQFDKPVDIVTDCSLDTSLVLIKRLESLYGYKVAISPVKNEVVYCVNIRYLFYRQVIVSLCAEIEAVDDFQSRITGTVRVSRGDLIITLLMYFGLTLYVLLSPEYKGILWMIVPIFSVFYIVQIAHTQQNMRDLLRRLDNILLTE